MPTSEFPRSAARPCRPPGRRTTRRSWRAPRAPRPRSRAAGRATAWPRASPPPAASARATAAGPGPGGGCGPPAPAAPRRARCRFRPSSPAGRRRTAPGRRPGGRCRRGRPAADRAAPLPQGALRDESAPTRVPRPRPPQPQVGVDARLDGGQPPLLQVRDLPLRELLVGEVGQGGASPQRERLGVGLRRACRRRRRRGRPGPRRCARRTGRGRARRARRGRGSRRRPSRWRRRPRRRRRARAAAATRTPGWFLAPVAGGRSPQSPSMSASVVTTSPARSSNIARTARCLRPPERDGPVADADLQRAEDSECCRERVLRREPIRGAPVPPDPHSRVFQRSFSDLQRRFSAATDAAAQSAPSLSGGAMSRTPRPPPSAPPSPPSHRPPRRPTPPGRPVDRPPGPRPGRDEHHADPDDRRRRLRRHRLALRRRRLRRRRLPVAAGDGHGRGAPAAPPAAPDGASRGPGGALPGPRACV